MKMHIRVKTLLRETLSGPVLELVFFTGLILAMSLAT